MPNATFRHDAATPLAANMLWNRLQDADTWANIGPVEKVWDARHDDDHLAGFRWSTSVGHTNYEGTADAVIVAEGSEMTLNLMTKELVGALTAEITPNGDGSAIGVTLDIEARGMLASLFFPAISQAVGSGLAGQVDQFVASLEG